MTFGKITNSSSASTQSATNKIEKPVKRMLFERSLCRKFFKLKIQTSTAIAIINSEAKLITSILATGWNTQYETKGNKINSASIKIDILELHSSVNTTSINRPRRINKLRAIVRLGLVQAYLPVGDKV